jgi:hypothetical protein
MTIKTKKRGKVKRIYSRLEVGAKAKKGEKQKKVKLA